MTLNIMACNEDIKLISSKKQTIIQGIHTTKPYTKYLFEITLVNAIDLRVDSVFIYDSNKIMNVNHLLEKSKSGKNYTLNASLIEGNYTSTENDSKTEEKVVIHYTVNNKSDKLIIKSFEEETVTRR